MKYQIVTYMNEYQRESLYDKFTENFEEYYPDNVRLKIYNEKLISSDYLHTTKRLLTIQHATEQLSADWIIWVDPNLLAIKEITQDFLNISCNNNHYHCYYGDPRNHFQFSTYWLAFNQHHGLNPIFVNSIKMILTNDLMKTKLEYSDAYLLDTIRSRFDHIGYINPFHNFNDKIHARNLFANSIMGEYFKLI